MQLEEELANGKLKKIYLTGKKLIGFSRNTSM
jgi:hypothetical protein